MMKLSRLMVVAVVALTLLPCAPFGSQEEPQRERCQAELDACLDWMAKFYRDRGWTGMQVDDVTREVLEVFPGSPADKQGIKPGDRLVAMNGLDLDNEAHREKLMELQQKMKPGFSVTYTMKREGKRRNYEFVLVALPFDAIARQVGMHMLTDHADVDIRQPD